MGGRTGGGVVRVGGQQVRGQQVRGRTLGAVGHSDAAAVLQHGDEAGDLELLCSLLIFILQDSRQTVSNIHGLINIHIKHNVKGWVI